MALSKITYTDKETLNPLPSVADKNKVTDDDMNEIKSVVNSAIDQVEANTIPQQATAPVSPNENDLWIDTDEPGVINIDSTPSTSSTNPIENQAITNYVNDLFKYSTTEHRIGTWINGKPLYSRWYTTTITSQSQNLLSITLSNYGILWVNKYFTKNTQNSIIGPYYYNSTDFQRVWVEASTSIMFQGGSSFPTRPSTIWFELRYTKSTD